MISWIFKLDKCTEVAAILACCRSRWEIEPRQFKDWNTLRLLQIKDPSFGSYQRAAQRLKKIYDKILQKYPSLETETDYKKILDIIGEYYKCNLICLETVIEAKVSHAYPPIEAPNWPYAYVNREILLQNKQRNMAHMNYINSIDSFQTKFKNPCRYCQKVYSQKTKGLWYLMLWIYNNRRDY